MKSPITGADMILKREQRSMVFRKKEYPVQYHCYFCPDSKEQFTTTELDELNLIQVYNQYRDKFNLPFPEEIRTTRELYGLSATKMAEVLGLGINCYRNYEQGEVPSESNARLIQVAQDPEEFWSIVRLGGSVAGKQLEKLKSRIDHLIKQKNSSTCVNLEEYLFGSMLPDEFSGYRKPRLDMLREMVLYFAEKVKPWKVKLNKLLFYADFLHFRKTGISMSGTRYCAIPMGPVPDNHQSIFELLEKQGAIAIESQEFSDGGIGERFYPGKDRAFDSERFSPGELNTLDLVKREFGNCTTREIIEISHAEPGWIDNVANRGLISYQKYGFDLKGL